MANISIQIRKNILAIHVDWILRIYRKYIKALTKTEWLPSNSWNSDFLLLAFWVTELDDVTQNTKKIIKLSKCKKIFSPKSQLNV